MLSYVFVRFGTIYSNRVTTHLKKNLQKSGNFIVVIEMSGKMEKFREMSYETVLGLPHKTK